MKSYKKKSLLIFAFCVFNSVAGHISKGNSKEDEVIDRIKNTVDHIYDHLKKQENFQDVKDLLQIDATLKRLEEQTKLLTSKLGNDLGRSGVSSNEIQLIENKLESMETELVSNVQGGIKKMSEVERQTNTLKNDMEKKLGKMMNVMTSVYEMNQKYVTGMTKPNANANDLPPVLDDKLEKMGEFFNEQFDSLAKKIDESVQIMKRELKRDLSSVESSITNTFETCEEFRENINAVKEQCANASQSRISSHVTPEMIQKITDQVTSNLTRNQRAINEKMEQKFKDLEAKLVQSTENQQKVKAESNRAGKTASVQSGNLEVQPPKTDDVPKKPDPIQCKRDPTNKSPKNCWELQKLGYNCDGIYIIYPEKRRTIHAYCDMTDDGGGWTILMRRGDYGPNRQSFDQNWKQYRDGFGDKTGEFWIGNENIHQLSHQLEVILRVTLEDFNGNRTFFDYEPFSVASEGMNYRLHIGRITEQAKTYIGYSLRHHNMKPFSTFDKNNDHPTMNHAAKFRGGWWYNRGHYALLTAPFFKPSEQKQKWEGMQWHAWSGNSLIKSAEMKIRPKYHKF